MASRKRGAPNGLKLSFEPANFNNNSISRKLSLDQRRIDHAKMCRKLSLDQTEMNSSRSYLIQPEMSQSPTQFSMSPTYHCISDGHLSPHGLGYTTMDQSMLLGSTSMSPLLPKTPTQCCSFLKQTSNESYGVGDLEHVHIDGMNNRQNPKEYDYADYGHQYEELPGGRKSIIKSIPVDSGIDSRSEYQSSGSGGATDIVSEHGDMANIINQSDKRKRVNPLYDGMTQSMPSIYSKVKGDNNESLKRQIRCLQCALIIFIVISCAAIAVSIYAIIASINADDDAAAALSPKVQQLSQELDNMEEVIARFEGGNSTLKILTDLSDKLARLEQNTTLQITALGQQLQNTESDIQAAVIDAENSQYNLSQTISQLNLTIQLQLHNISKMEGPRGPQGVANFSKCSYKNVSNNAVADNYPSFSPWTPTEIELETNFGFFVGCTVDGGESAKIEINAISQDAVQYRCQCEGTEQGKNRRFCYVHVIGCPRNSVLPLP